MSGSFTFRRVTAGLLVVVLAGFGAAPTATGAPQPVARMYGVPQDPPPPTPVVAVPDLAHHQSRHHNGECDR